MKFNRKKKQQYINNMILKWAEDLNKYFSKEYIPMCNRYMKSDKEHH